MKCMVHTDVGVRCRQCAPPQRVIAGRSKSLLGIVGVVFLVILAVGYLGSRGGSGDGDFGYDDYYDDYSDVWDYEITVSRVEDPWLGEDGGREASPGYRLVALEVVVGAAESNPEAYRVDAYYFKVTDEEGFAYGPVDSGAKPAFPQSVLLEPGEKTRGWVTFELADDNSLESLSSYDKTIPLTDELSRAR
jgi:hypothetical protein